MSEIPGAGFSLTVSIFSFTPLSLCFSLLPVDLTLLRLPSTIAGKSSGGCKKPLFEHPSGLASCSGARGGSHRKRSHVTLHAVTSMLFSCVQASAASSSGVRPDRPSLLTLQGAPRPTATATHAIPSIRTSHRLEGTLPQQLRLAFETVWQPCCKGTAGYCRTEPLRPSHRFMISTYGKADQSTRRTIRSQSTLPLLGTTHLLPSRHSESLRVRRLPDSTTQHAAACTQFRSSKTNAKVLHSETADWMDTIRTHLGTGNLA